MNPGPFGMTQTGVPFGEIAAVRACGAEWVIGIGGFAGARARHALAGIPNIRFGRILHPSPASPAANRGWAKQSHIRCRRSACGIIRDS